MQWKFCHFSPAAMQNFWAESSRSCRHSSTTRGGSLKLQAPFWGHALLQTEHFLFRYNPVPCWTLRTSLHWSIYQPSVIRHRSNEPFLLHSTEHEYTLKRIPPPKMWTSSTRNWIRGQTSTHCAQGLDKVNQGSSGNSASLKPFLEPFTRDLFSAFIA